MSPKCLIIFLLYFCNAKAQQVLVQDLVCEYHHNPVGLEATSPRLSWKISTEENNWMQAAYEIWAAHHPADLQNGKKLIWRTGKVASEQSIQVPYAGPALKSREQVYWQVRVWGSNSTASAWSPVAHWEMGILDKKEFTAHFIGTDNFTTEKKSHPAQYYRKAFDLKKKIKQARVYATALGLYELHINGRKVTEDVFTPGYTSYKHRLQYQVYDVTELLEKQNVIGAILGDGWYRGNIGWQNDYAYYGKQLGLLVQLEITLADGSVEVIGTDTSWKTNYGPILESDMYNGELYDATKELVGWQRYSYEETDWKASVLVEYDKKKLVASVGSPVRRIEEVRPKKMITTPKGEQVLDLGQNIVGWAKMKVQGPKGHKVVLKFAEVLDKDGNFYTVNLRRAKATDTYVLKGEGVEEFEPHFTSHGFRYIQVIDYPGEIVLENFTGVVVHSDMKETGLFETSDASLNQLQSNIRWGQKDNFLDIPTDCPQRDERAGWTGDAQVFSNTAAFNFNVAPFYTKWLADLKADQLPSGLVPHVIPDILSGKGGATGWADAAVIMPWNVYLAYGDIEILKSQYASMKAWVDYMAVESGEDYLWNNPKHWHWGDWLAYNADKPDYNGSVTEKDLIATAYNFYSTTLFSKAAAVLGKLEDEKKYKEHAQKIQEAFTKEYMSPNSRLVSHTQTAYALALSFGLIPEQRIAKAANYFAQDVERFGHLTTGFLGTPLLCPTLSAIGREDLAFKLLFRKEFPSWLYPITMGATTIWERWDTQKPDGTILEGMNSFNHYAYGAIGEWMYAYIGGLNKSESAPGYKEIIFDPHPGHPLTHANTKLESMYGTVVSNWKIEDGRFIYKLQIPPNTRGLVVLPEKEVLLNGNALDSRKIEDYFGQKAYRLGSGVYQLSWMK